MMKELGNSFTDLDLKCDFSARESFREALLARLLDLDERAPWQPTAVAGGRRYQDDSEARELSDSELEMLAAAKGDLTSHDLIDDLTGSPGLRRS